MTFVRKTRMFYIVEIDSLCQFNQSITNSFLLISFCKKLYKYNILEKLRKRLLYKKPPRKMLVKLTQASLIQLFCNEEEEEL